MNRTFLLLPLAFALSSCSLQGESPLPTAEAQKKLHAGAVLVDVRTAAEFKSMSLPGAANVPVDQIQSGITNVATNKSQVILLHCRSGRRSAIAETELRSLGYTNAFNIGSFDAAQKVVEPSKD